MNTKSTALTILAYGDSNTYGQKPDRSGRFDASTRWTGVLQTALGDNYYVIEEGLGGRTTNLDHPNPNKPSRNGFPYFAACLESHGPLDIIILMLGTNDFKTTYNRSPEEIAQALQSYIDTIQKSYTDNSTKSPTIILVSPPHMNHNAPLFYSSMPTPGIYDETSVLKSRELPAHLQQLAANNGIVFIDSTAIVETGEDGCHMDEASHSKLGAALNYAIAG